MALTVIPGQNRSAMLGQSVGKGLGQGLQSLMDDKMNIMMQKRQQHQTAQGLEALGIPSHESSQISLLPKELQSHVVKSYLEGAESAGLNNALSSLGGETTNAQGLEEILPSQPQAALKMQPQQDIGFAQQPINKLMELPIQQQRQANEKQSVPEQKRSTFKEILKNPRLKPEHRIRIEQMAQQERLADKKLRAQENKEQLIERREIDKVNKPVVDEINKKYKSSINTDRRLGRMEELINKGNLTRPRLHSLLKTISQGVFGFGLDLHSLESADSQEFNKLSSEFLKGARDIFGANVTNFEAEQFLKMIPNLSQTKEGKLRIINNIKLFNEGDRIKKRAMDDIIEENNGRSPRNLDSLVEKRVKHSLESLADQFKQGLTQNKIKEPTKSILETNPLTQALDVAFGRG